ncbi:rpt-4 [Symbiodinium microadriaticum]|nr:rpt-4 [Symbiodinium microadriaticum]
MVYSNKFVMCVLLNGKPQEELANGQVKLPFGAEYALRLRNRNNRRAVVKLYIDGENVSGGGYVVNANDFVDIKRHHDVDRAFKFVSLDSPDAIDYGKNGPNEDKVKGTIEARFYLEKEQPKVVYRDIHHDHHHHHHHDHYHPRPLPRPRPYPYTPTPPIWFGTCQAGNNTAGLPDEGGMDAGGFEMLGGGAEMTCSTGGGGTQSSATPRRSRSKSTQETFYSADVPAVDDAVLKDGCTVEGYSTGQSFHTVWVDTEETFTSLKVFLQGYEEEEAPVVVQKKKKPAKKVSKRKTNKDRRLDDLESENEELRRKLAEIENEELKKKLDKKKKEKNDQTGVGLVTTEEKPRGNEEIAVERHGDKIIIPEGMELHEAQRYLREKEEEEETVVSVTEDVNAFPLDGAVAFANVLRKRYGWTSLKSTPGAWGSSNPPQMIGVPIGHNENVQVPWGRCEVPNITGYLQTGYNFNEQGLPTFRISGEVRRKHESTIAEIAQEVRNEVAKNSIYKGKAFRINFRDAEGDRIDDFSVTFSPTFLDMEKHSRQILIYSEATRRVVQTNLLNPIQNTEKCRKVGIPLKRGILLAGGYGTGKTLTGYQLASECVKHGWSFVYLEDVRDIDMALSFARMYMPCVVFSEDVDRTLAGPRTTDMDRQVNVIDGILSKDTEIMLVLTTNHKNHINPVALRPGRMDTIVEVGPPDDGAILELVRSYGNMEQDCVVKASDEEIIAACDPLKGANAAFFREIVERAKLSAITHSNGAQVIINKDDIHNAALTLQDHAESVQPEFRKNGGSDDYEQVDPLKMMVDIGVDMFAGAFIKRLTSPKVVQKALSEALGGKNKRKM